MEKYYRYKTVLLVDDNPIDNLIGTKILQSSYYAEKIMVIESPEEAIDFIRKSISLQTDIPEVLFLDLRMPGMTGLDFLKELDMIEGMADHHLKIYILSSSLDPKDYSMIQKNKMISKFIGKPLTAEILAGI